MTSSTKTYAAVFAVLVIIIAVVYFSWIRPGMQEDAVPGVEAPTPTPEPEPTPTLAERLSERLQGTTLKTSDTVVRELVAELSANPKLVAWLANEDLIRRSVAAVDNTANGISPRSQLDFMRPKGSFKVIEKGDEITIDPKSYGRYDLATQVVVSLDTEGSGAVPRARAAHRRRLRRDLAPRQPVLRSPRRRLRPPPRGDSAERRTRGHPQGRDLCLRGRVAYG